MAWIEEQVDARVAELRGALLVRLDRTDKFPFADDCVDLDVLILAGELLLHPSQIEGGPPSGNLGRRQDRREGRRVGVGRGAEDDSSAAEFHRGSVAWPRPQALHDTRVSRWIFGQRWGAGRWTLPATPCSCRSEGIGRGRPGGPERRVEASDRADCNRE